MTNHELTKRELAQREQIFLREHSEIGVVASEPAKPHPEIAAPAGPLRRTAPRRTASRL